MSTGYRLQVAGYRLLGVSAAMLRHPHTGVATLSAVKGVVLVAVDGPRSAIQPVVEDRAITGGEASVVGASHEAFLAADGPLTAFEVAGFAPCELAGANALGDAALLVSLSLGDGLRHADGAGEGEKRGGNDGKFHLWSPSGEGLNFPSALSFAFRKVKTQGRELVVARSQQLNSR